MIFKILLFIISSLKPSLCSRIVDSLSQDSIYISDYCPEMKYCKDGSHVLCMYYDEDKPRGPLCRNYVNTIVTTEMIDNMLENINNARARVATGIEVGKDDVLLPRAYGMMRLKWDKELATFAQVLADQCFIVQYDHCRATNRFANPSQNAGLVNFFHPDWQYFSNNMNDTEPGLNEEKIMFGIKRIMNSWLPDKKPVTKEQILNFPSPEREQFLERTYLNTIRGGATHMGCGISAFSKYNYQINNRNDIVNVLNIICNFSDSPQVSQPVYMTDPPIPGTGFTEECGCPTGYKESDGCLCEEDMDYVKPTTSTVPAYVPNHKNNKLREGPLQSVVITPYVTESTPIDEEFTEKPPSQHHTYSHKGKIYKPQNNKPMPKTNSVSKPNIISKTRFKKIKPETKYAFLPIFKFKSGPDDMNLERTRPEERPSLIKFDNSTFVPRKHKAKYVSASDEHFEDFKDKPSKKHYKSEKVFLKNNEANKENDDSHVTISRRAHNRRSKVEESDENSVEEVIHKYSQFKELPDLTDLTDFSSPEQSVDHHPNTRRRGYNDEDNTKNNIIKQTNDHNLMNLLDILEHKVRTIDMTLKEKEIFDAKMRKIYKAVWSKQKQTQQMRQRHLPNNNHLAKPIPKLKQKQNDPNDSGDIENEFRELKDLLKLKSQQTENFDHESFHNMRRIGNDNTAKVEKKALKPVHRRNNDMLDQRKRKFEQIDRDMIDDKLLEILRHKNEQIIDDGENKLTNDVNGRQTYMDRHMRDINELKANDNRNDNNIPNDNRNDNHIPNDNRNDNTIPNNEVEPIDYDDERDYTNVPVPRKQETFNKYDKRTGKEVPDTDDRKVVKLNNVHANSDVDYPQRESHVPLKIGKDHIVGDRRMSSSHHSNNSVRPSERRMSYSDGEHHDTRPFRRVEDYNLERPIRRFQMNEINTHWKNKIHRITNPYYLSDRATN